MKPATQFGILATLGGLILWLASGDAMLRLVLPSLRIPLVLTGSVLMTLAFATLVHALLARRRGDPAAGPDHELHDHVDTGGHGDHHDHGVPRIGLLLLAPVLFAVAFNVRPLPRQDAAPKPKPVNFFKLIAAAPTTTTTPVELSKFSKDDPPVDTTINALNNAPLFNPEPDILRRPIRLVGYVDNHEANSFVLTRYDIYCCVADATAVSVRVLSSHPVDDGAWFQVEGIYERPPPDAAGTGFPMPLITALNIKAIPEPDDPYEH